MSTTLHEGESFTVTRFSGGIERGVCIQIGTRGHNFVQLTLTDAARLAEILREATGPAAAPAGYVLVPVDAPESLRGQLCGYGADLGYMDPGDRAVIVQRGAERWAEILRWAGALGVSGSGETP